MSGELRKVPVTLYGPNGEVISEINPLPVELTGKSEVTIKEPVKTEVENKPGVTVEGTPNVNVANKPGVTVEGEAKVAIENEPTVKLGGTGKVEVTNEPSVKVEPGLTPTESKIIGEAGHVAVVNAEGKLEVVGIGTVGEIEGKLRLGEDITAESRPVLIGGIIQGKLENTFIEVDSNGQIQVSPLNTRSPFTKYVKGAVDKLERVVVAPLAKYRAIVTTVCAVLYVAEETTAVSTIELELRTEGGGESKYEWKFGLPTKTLAGTSVTLLELASNPVYIAQAVDQEVVFNCTAVAKCSVSLCLGGYMVAT